MLIDCLGWSEKELHDGAACAGTPASVGALPIDCFNFVHAWLRHSCSRIASSVAEDRSEGLKRKAQSDRPSGSLRRLQCMPSKASPTRPTRSNSMELNRARLTQLARRWERARTIESANEWLYRINAEADTEILERKEGSREKHQLAELPMFLPVLWWRNTFARSKQRSHLNILKSV
jgi:hypothetical protein